MMTRQDIITFLHSFRGPDSSDPLYKWIGTYNTFRIVEVMFKASTDDGNVWRKDNLSNSSDTESVNSEIAPEGHNVYVTWWERANQTSNKPVLRISTDNGKTFGIE
jgi:hypothetical protein